MELVKLLTIFCVLTSVLSAPAPRSKSKSPATTYDQKQTGDYNIQLHLKDFQIIALLADDTLGGLADYDYAYDYADFTVKPTSQKPTTSTTTTTQKPETTTLKTSSVPAVSITTYSPTKPPKPFTSPIEPAPLSLSTNLNTENSLEFTSKPPKSNSVRIVIEEEKKTESPITSISIVPPEDVGSFSDHISLGEIIHYRKCANGYARDKRGRCRKIRRPQMSFDASKLATIVSNFQQSKSIQ